MVINVLISTIGPGIERVAKMLLPYQQGVEYIVVHQLQDETSQSIPPELIRDDVRVLHQQGKGLSRSRNLALSKADGDIAVLADDDIAFFQDSFQIIKNAYADDPDLDVACFKIKTPEGEPPYKIYPLFSYAISKGKRHYLSSVEITFRIKRIKGKHIRFDERFGLGSPHLICGEEKVFIYDCKNASLNIWFLPEFIVKHGYYNSLKGISYFDKRRVMPEGAYDAYTSGRYAILKAVYWTMRLTPAMIKRRKNPIKYLIERLEGVNHILRDMKSGRK